LIFFVRQRQNRHIRPKGKEGDLSYQKGKKSSWGTRIGNRVGGGRGSDENRREPLPGEKLRDRGNRRRGGWFDEHKRDEGTPYLIYIKGAILNIISSQLDHQKKSSRKKIA